MILVYIQSLASNQCLGIDDVQASVIPHVWEMGNLGNAIPSMRMETALKNAQANLLQLIFSVPVKKERRCYTLFKTKRRDKKRGETMSYN